MSESIDARPVRRAQHVALRNQRREVAGHSLGAELLRADEHVRESRMDRQLGHRSPVRRRDAGVVYGVQLDQQLARLGERCRGRRVEPGELRGLGDACHREVERERSQVGVQNLGRRLLEQMGGLVLRPKTVADARRRFGRRAHDADRPRISRRVPSRAGSSPCEARSAARARARCRRRREFPRS